MILCPSIVLSFDVEEFDLPTEYGHLISKEEQLEMGKAGLSVVEQMLASQQVPATLFTTANFANNYPAQIKKLAVHHEIGSHAFYHDSFCEQHLLDSRLSLEAIIEKPVKGFRMPRMHPIEPLELLRAGYLYDSSINPTWVPGRYNNLKWPKTMWRQEGLIRVPVSVSPNFRFPLFWLSFKNIPYVFYRKMALNALRADGYLSLYFHPWEFVDITQYRIPHYIKKKCGNRLIDLLNRLIEDLKNEAQFNTMESLVSTMQ